MFPQRTTARDRIERKEKANRDRELAEITQTELPKSNQSLPKKILGGGTSLTPKIEKKKRQRKRGGCPKNVTKSGIKTSHNKVETGLNCWTLSLNPGITGEDGGKVDQKKTQKKGRLL